jgi:hypothetical protein
MVTLAATIARRRIYYPRPLACLPDILMIDTPRRSGTLRRGLKRFRPIMVETVDEHSEIEAFLDEEREGIVAPDLLDERLSTFPREHLTIAHYRPSEAGWPYVQLCQWPADFAARFATSGRLFARGAYTFELFGDRPRLEKAAKALVASLDRRHAPHVEIVFPDWSNDPGASPH